MTQELRSFIVDTLIISDRALEVLEKKKKKKKEKMLLEHEVTEVLFLVSVISAVGYYRLCPHYFTIKSQLGTVH